MRIVHIVTRLNAGGIARQVVWLADALQRSGHEVMLVTGKVAAGETDGTYTFHGHVFRGYFSSLVSTVVRGVERALARFTDAYIVLSPSQRAEICDEYRIGRQGQYALIPVALTVDPTTTKQARSTRLAVRAALGLSADEFAFGLIGRLTAIKNHEMFLRAAAVYLKKGARARVRFLVIGDGELRSKLESTAASLGLGGTVQFMGFRRDIADLYDGLDAVVLSSQNEGTPLVLIEAMAHERPVLATRVGGVPDLLGDGASPCGQGYEVCRRGLMVAPDDVSAMAAGMWRLASDPVLRAVLGKRGHTYVEKKHAPTVCLHRTIQLYAERHAERDDRSSHSTDPPTVSS